MNFGVGFVHFLLSLMYTASQQQLLISGVAAPFAIRCRCWSEPVLYAWATVPDTSYNLLTSLDILVSSPMSRLRTDLQSKSEHTPRDELLVVENCGLIGAIAHEDTRDLLELLSHDYISVPVSVERK